jgi:proteasome lid subunit RPN8/RPN11
VAHAREEAPRECCGLVLGLDGTARRVVRCRNVDPEPTLRYRVDPDDARRVIAALDDEDRELVAIYHSHPRSEPAPSATDRREARWWRRPFYILVSLRGETPELRAYRISEDEVAQAEVLSQA